MAKVNYDEFNTFDINEACDFFDVDDRKAWNKINQFVVADGQDFHEVMESEFDFEDTGDGEYAAFEAGVKYALTKMNKAFEAAGLELEVQEVDLVESMGYLLVRVDDTPEDFVLRVLKKPRKVVDSWI
jgi:hypothetical protein